MRSIPCIFSVSLFALAALAACTSSDPQSPAPASDAGSAIEASDAAPPEDAAFDAIADAAFDAGRDAGACFACAKTSYTCVDDSDGQSFTVAASKNADGSCAFGGGTLACGGTGTAQNGKPAAWSAGPNVGPSGGAGIHVDYGTLQVNCE